MHCIVLYVCPNHFKIAGSRFYSTISKLSDDSVWAEAISEDALNGTLVDVARLLTGTGNDRNGTNDNNEIWFRYDLVHGSWYISIWYIWFMIYYLMVSYFLQKSIHRNLQDYFLGLLKRSWWNHIQKKGWPMDCALALFLRFNSNFFIRLGGQSTSADSTWAFINMFMVPWFVFLNIYMM